LAPIYYLASMTGTSDSADAMPEVEWQNPQLNYIGFHNC
jgi:hypothetical protein